MFQDSRGAVGSEGVWRARHAANADIEAALRALAQRASQLLGGLCELGTISHDGCEFERVAEFADDQELLQRFAPEFAARAVPLSGLPMIQDVVRTGLAIWVDDIQRSNWLPPKGATRDRFELCHARAAACVPLISKHQLLGVLSLTRFGVASKPLETRDLDSLQMFADHAVQLMAGVQVARDAAAAARRWQVLLDVTRVFAEEGADYTKLLHVIAARTSELMGGLCVLGLVEGSTFDVWISEYVEKPEVAEELGRLAGRRGLALDSSHPSATAARTGVPVSMSYEQVLERLKETPPHLAQPLMKHDVRCSVAVPMRSKGSVIGTLSVTRFGAQAVELEAADVTLIQIVADHAAQAIVSARHLAAVERELIEHKRTRQSLELVEERLRQAAKMEAIGRLAGGVAHDFNNLLTVILSYASLALDDSSMAAPLRESVSEIRRAGERAAQLTQQLLTFSRQQVTSPRVLSIENVMLEMKPMLERLLGEDVTLRTVSRPGLWRCRIDPTQIEQIVMNLAINARDAMPYGGTLTIEALNVELDDDYVTQHPEAVAGPYVVLVVTDTGEGMSRDVLARIFEPFFTTKPRGSGTGLGLATVYGIAAQSGGCVSVYSEIGHGTTFRVYFPRAEGEEPAPRPRPTLQPVSGTEQILLVEDDEQVRTLVKRVLAPSGYRVLDAQDSNEALELFARYGEQLDLVIADVVMPGMSGPKLAAQLLQQRPALKILYMSGYTESTLERRQFEAGARFVAKPLVPSALLRAVRDALDA